MAQETGEVNAADALNRLLEKHTVKYVGRSFEFIVGGNWDPPERGPRQSPAPPPPPAPPSPPPVHFAPARVRDSFLVSAEQLQFDKLKIVNLPTEAILVQRGLHNCGNAHISESILLTAETTVGSSVEKSTGLSTTSGAQITGSVGVPVVGNVDVQLSWSQTVSTSTTQSEKLESRVTRQETVDITLEPYSAVNASLLVYKVGVEIPFKANVVVDGNLVENASELKLASQLLSVAERTFPVVGRLRIADASRGQVRTDDYKCDGKSPIENTPEMVFQLHGIRDDFMKGFVTASLDDELALAWEGPEIGRPDGTHYTILFKREVTRATPACGYNDIGVPNAGIYDVETRQYSTYKDGKLIRQWTKNVETFKRCHHP